MADLGTDFSTFLDPVQPDLDPTFAPISGTRAVAECWARGLLMPRGRLVDVHDDQRYGFDLRRYLSARITKHTLFEIKVGAEREAKLDERVATANADVTYDAATNKITLKGSGTTRDGVTFELVLAVGKLTTELLKAA